ncbi:MAG: hypothetical protein ACI837_000640 [Crocinitomicaceae bacterium]|jgi:hypothetical protein
MFKNILLATVIIISFNSATIAQQDKCDILMYEFMGNGMTNNELITSNLKVLLECGDYNAMTKSYFSAGHRVFDVMSKDISRFLGDVSYSVLLEHIDTLLMDDVFLEEMWYITEMDRITEEPSTLEVFEANEKFFRLIEPNEVVFEEIRTYFKELGPTEMNMRASIRAFYTEKVNAEAAAEKEPERKKVKWYPYQALNDIDTATAGVNYTDLFVAVYFTDKSDEKSREMETEVLSDQEVTIGLGVKCIEYQAFCDDPTVLSAADQKKFAAYFGKPVKTVGQKNTLYREKLVNGSGSPTFVILSGGGNVVGSTGFMSSPVEFRKFLKSCTGY